MNPTLVFLLLDNRSRSPFAIRGTSGVKYADAYYEEKQGGHVFRMTVSDFVKCGKDLIRGFNLPLCAFMPVDVEFDLPDTAGEIASLTAERDALTARLKKYEKPRADWNFKDYYTHAKAIGLPRYSIIARGGNRDALVAAVEQYEASTQAGANGDQASFAGAEAKAPV